MSVKLYIGGLPYRTTEDAFRDAFAGAGEVTSARIITDKMTGRSRGFGFIEMADQAGADAAIAMWDGKEFEGRKLMVNVARPMEERPKREFQQSY
ncbi:MAG: RNA-binding protein [Candidatus Pacebacteria bacterium]|jgi:RNA recognition motif-containing protein|nr:RNA-binding protein [Candidatus Paceibacterota bacterium]